ncbi:unnamed protein product, partial [Mesorhabditis belari]|uniref:SHSP domain-containing protein n=1 Tax=Mesorhabditis belari TaxID=2138241 RepID=A0AAF3F245_9BILA
MSIKIEPIEVRYKGKKFEPPRANDVGVLRISQDDNTFQVTFDVNGYTSKEIKVIGRHGLLEVHCNPSNRADAPPPSVKSCHFPNDVDCSTVRSNMTSTGTLEINAKKY